MKRRSRRRKRWGGKTMKKGPKGKKFGIIN